MLPAFGWFILSAVLLGWVFVALAYLISVSVSEKSRAAGLALVVWFLFVLVFDLGLLALLVASEGNLNSTLLNTLLMLNPTDVFRLINYLAVDAAEYGGVLQIAQTGEQSLAALFAVMTGWVVAPLLLAGLVFQRRGV